MTEDPKLLINPPAPPEPLDATVLACPPSPPKPPCPPEPPTVILEAEASAGQKVRPTLFIETFGTDCSVLYLLHAMDVIPRGMEELVWDLIGEKRSILDLNREEAEAIDYSVPELVSCLGRKGKVEKGPDGRSTGKITIYRDIYPPKVSDSVQVNPSFPNAYDWLKD